MTLDGRLRELVGKVENSHLSQKEKEDIYATISFGLHASVWPVLVAYMPEEELARFQKDTSGVTPEIYTGLVRSAIDDPSTEADLDGLMQATLSGVEKVLKEKFIIQG